MAAIDVTKADAPGTNGTATSSVKENGKSKNDAPKPVDIGMESEIKDLYQGPEDTRGRWTWTDEQPELEKTAEDETTAKYAILIRHKKVYSDSRKTLEIDSIVIQSPLLKKVLGVVLANYPGITTSLKRLTFAAPFNAFVHRWEEFSTALKDETDGTTKEHLTLLYETLKGELAETLAAKEDFIANRVITFDNIWTIFQPGCTIYTVEYDRDCALKFTQGQYINHDRYGRCYQLSSKKIDWDGEKFGYTGEAPLIFGFAGTKTITNLEAFPLEFHPAQGAIAAKLLARGKLFEHYAGYHYKMYTGIAIAQTQCGPAKINVDSRIIIDRYAHNRFNPNQNRSVEALKEDIPSSNSSDSEDDDSSYWDENEEYTAEAIAVKGKQFKRFPLTNRQLILCTPLIKGYALKTKRWLQFFVDEVSDIIWNTKAFESLVLPDEQKELILSFAESQILYKEKFDDLISGKGKGIIMLLSGSPGVGKTLTAESVSEHMKVPLYMMGASDLGTHSSEVETSLTRILEMVAKWNAVLLLDECDVFLEARNANDLERNKLVSIFLRTLEYYEGILFLTTNRVDNMDAAFQSRIHISMEYPPLDDKSRRQVWTNFLDRGIEHELSAKDLDTLARVDLNGRQIKNVLKTSQLLACRKKSPLKFEHLKTVLDVEKKSGSFQVIERSVLL